MIVVADAGPIVHLSLVGRLDLLPALFARVTVPRVVWDEVVVAGRGMAGSAELAAADWIDVTEHDGEAPLHRALREELDPGEAAALCIASLRGADLVLMDERLGRAVARRIGLEVKGTLGILVDAKRAGLLAAVAPVVASLVGAGVWLAPGLVQAVCEHVGEDIPGRTP